MSVPKVGTKKKLTHPQGLGESIGAIPFGAEFEVVEVVGHGTQGVGFHTEEAAGIYTVIVGYDEPGLVLDDNGNVVKGFSRRHVSLSQTEYNQLLGDTDGG